jgi:hypothetical protein
MHVTTIRDSRTLHVSGDELGRAARDGRDRHLVIDVARGRRLVTGPLHGDDGQPIARPVAKT